MAFHRRSPLLLGSTRNNCVPYFFLSHTPGPGHRAPRTETSPHWRLWVDGPLLWDPHCGPHPAGETLCLSLFGGNHWGSGSGFITLESLACGLIFSIDPSCKVSLPRSFLFSTLGALMGPETWRQETQLVALSIPQMSCAVVSRKSPFPESQYTYLWSEGNYVRCP